MQFSNDHIIITSFVPLSVAHHANTNLYPDLTTSFRNNPQPKLHDIRASLLWINFCTHTPNILNKTEATSIFSIYVDGYGKKRCKSLCIMYNISATKPIHESFRNILIMCIQKLRGICIFQIVPIQKLSQLNLQFF